MPIILRPFHIEDAAAVAKLYCACFAEAPWFERFEPSDVAAEFVDMHAMAGSIILVAEDHGCVVGVAAGYPLSERDDMDAFLPNEAFGQYYFAELFVHQNYRQRGLARRLIEARIQQARRLGFTQAAVRTSVAQEIIQQIYQSRDFRIVARQDVESLKFIDGVEQVVPDERVILFGVM